MKKRIIFIGIIVIALIIIFIIWLLVPAPASESIQNMVLENEPDYTITALIYYKDYQQQNADMLTYSPVLQPIEGIYVIDCQIGLFDSREIKLSESDGISAMTVRNSYLLNDLPWCSVQVYDGFVSFGNGGREALVYSIYGTRPSYVHNPDDDYDCIWVHKITDNWYHARGEQIYVNGHRIRGK